MHTTNANTSGPQQIKDGREHAGSGNNVEEIRVIDVAALNSNFHGSVVRCEYVIGQCIDAREDVDTEKINEFCEGDLGVVVLDDNLVEIKESSSGVGNTIAGRLHWCGRSHLVRSRREVLVRWTPH